MTSQTPTCRDVVERLVSHFKVHGILDDHSPIVYDARLALGQPDSDSRSLEIANGRATQYHDEIVRLERLLGEKDRALDAANKRAEDAEKRLRELESVTGKTIAQHGDILERHIDNVEFLANWLLDRLVERGAS